MQHVGILLLSALAYYVCGKLGIYLAIPPGYATAVWPSSGVALALVIRFGPAALPGIWLGSYLINASISNAFSTPTLTTLMIPGIIALGAVLQAYLGQLLVQRFVGRLWFSVQAILMILFLGGPLSCLLAATIGVTTLLTFEQITPNLYGDIWLTWWIGDTLGVLAFTPALLVILVSPSTVALSKRFTVVTPLVIMFTLVTIAYIFVRDSEEKQRRELVVGALSEIRHNIEQELNINEEITEILAAYFSTEKTPTLTDFNRLTQQYLRHHPSIQALEWVPLVRDADRIAFEAEQRRQVNPDFRIMERNSQGVMVPAQRRAEYFPVTYVDPILGNEAALGFDLGSNATRYESIKRSLEQRVSTISDPVHLVQMPDHQFGYLLLTPVFTYAKPNARSTAARKLPKGFILMVFMPDQLVASANPGLEAREIAFSLYDISTPHGKTTLMQNANGLSAYRQNQFVTLANRTWDLELTPTFAFLQQSPHWQSYAVLFAGWPFIMVLGVLLIILVGRQIAIETKVVEKTAALEQATQRAQQASRAKSDFLANMSHELRTPLNSIIGFTHQVVTKKAAQLDDRAQDSLHTVERNAKHLLQLINDLLDISKIEAGKFELHYEQFDVMTLCKDVVEPFQQLAREKHLTLTIDCPESLQLQADRLRIYQTLLNLVANAIRFTQQGGVQLSAVSETRQGMAGVCFNVSDTGSGIPADKQAMLFNKFVQLEESRQTGTGTGLGLALAKEIATLHRGDIQVQSNAGHGSTFKVWLPAKHSTTIAA